MKEVGYVKDDELFGPKEKEFRMHQRSAPNVRNNNYKRLGCSSYEDYVPEFQDMESELWVYGRDPALNKW